MTVAAGILVATGILMLFVGAVSGIPMGLTRMKDGNPKVPKYLIMLHLAGYQQAPILLSLGAVFQLLEPEGWAAYVGPALFAFSAVLLVLKELFNWLQGVGDEFVEDSLGLKVGNVFGPIHIVGLLVCTIAIVPELF